MSPFRVKFFKSFIAIFKLIGKTLLQSGFSLIEKNIGFYSSLSLTLSDRYVIVVNMTKRQLGLSF
jgi:hypothetical protein